MIPDDGQHLTMPCDIETRRPEPHRKAAYHRDCPYPNICACAAHERDRSGADREAVR